MLKIGLTGGIGSGKTRVADLLKQWGATVIDTDEISRTLTAARGAAMPAIEQAFGVQALAEDGALNRDWMRERIFLQPEERVRLEAILHPLISRRTEQEAANASGLYVVFVVPLLVESGRWGKRVDRICVVDCDPQTQISRVKTRSGLTEPAIRRIMAAQVARAVRLEAADDVIVNDGQTSADQLRERTKTHHEPWCVMAAHKVDGAP